MILILLKIWISDTNFSLFLQINMEKLIYFCLLASLILIINISSADPSNTDEVDGGLRDKRKAGKKKDRLKSDIKDFIENRMEEILEEEIEQRQNSLNNLENSMNGLEKYVKNEMGLLTDLLNDIDGSQVSILSNLL